MPFARLIASPTRISRRSGSLVTRVARSAALAAAASALLAAVGTSLLGGFLLQREEDRRLVEAALVLVFELREEEVTPERMRAVVLDEHAEMQHAGMHFAVLGPDGGLLAGNERLLRLARDECATDRFERMRACRVEAGTGLSVVAASAHTSAARLFLVAAMVAAAVAGVITFLWSRPMARAAVAPLSRLRSRVAAIDVGAGARGELGPDERVLEVDELRTTIAQLMARVGAALEQEKRFSANAAHELRTPLTAVHAELELLAESAVFPGEVQQSLATLRARMTDLAALVEKLLLLASPKRTFAEPNEIVSLRDVVEDVVRTLTPERAARVSVPDADALVRGDALLLATMVSNGLRNALEYGEHVWVALALGAGEVLLCIEDDGPGLSEQECVHVFEPFNRGAEALRRRVPGHGLGLALVRHIAESHGGSARLAQAPGRGARLELRLPLYRD